MLPLLGGKVGMGVGGGGGEGHARRGGLACLPIAHITRPNFYQHTYIRHTLAFYTSTVQLLNRRNGDEGLGCFPIFKPRFNEMAGELLTRYCT